MADSAVVPLLQASLENMETQLAAQKRMSAEKGETIAGFEREADAARAGHEETAAKLRELESSKMMSESSSRVELVTIDRNPPVPPRVCLLLHRS